MLELQSRWSSIITTLPTIGKINGMFLESFSRMNSSLFGGKLQFDAEKLIGNSATVHQLVESICFFDGGIERKLRYFFVKFGLVLV